MDTSPQPLALQATVEDYHSSEDDDSVVLSPSSIRNRTNVSTKRATLSTKQSNSHLKNVSKNQEPLIVDLRSDSGYSSYTTSTRSSADWASSTNNDIRLRVDGSAPLNLQLSGDMEGRTLQLVPAENGMTDLVIGNTRDGEKAYHTERGGIEGATKNRRTVVEAPTRRRTEYDSDRSSRSPRGEVRYGQDDRNRRPSSRSREPAVVVSARNRRPSVSRRRPMSYYPPGTQAYGHPTGDAQYMPPYPSYPYYMQQPYIHSYGVQPQPPQYSARYGTSTVQNNRAPYPGAYSGPNMWTTGPMTPDPSPRPSLTGPRPSLTGPPVPPVVIHHHQHSQPTDWPAPTVMSGRGVAHAESSDSSYSESEEDEIGFGRGNRARALMPPPSVPRSRRAGFTSEPTILKATTNEVYVPAKEAGIVPRERKSARRKSLSIGGTRPANEADVFEQKVQRLSDEEDEEETFIYHTDGKEARGSSVHLRKDPDAPKRGLSAYMFFANEEREKVREDNPGIKFGEVGRILNEKWKALPDKQRSYYEAMAAADKQRYEEEKAAYQAQETASVSTSVIIDCEEDIREKLREEIRTATAKKGDPPDSKSHDHMRNHGASARFRARRKEKECVIETSESVPEVDRRSVSLADADIQSQALKDELLILSKVHTSTSKDSTAVSPVIPASRGSSSESAVDMAQEQKYTSSVSSEDESEEASEECEVHVEGALSSAMNVVKNLLLRELLDYTLPDATDAVDGPGASTSGGTGSSASSSLASSSSRNSQTPQRSKRSRGGGRDPGDGDGDGDNSDDEDRPKKKGGRGVGDRFPQRRLKCPFYQRQPEKYTKAACRGTGFADMAKLKDHIKRVHTQPLRCPRCWLEMDSDDAYHEHLQQEIICQKGPEPQEDRIRPQLLKRLDFKKAPYSNARNVEEKWKMLFSVLFPSDSTIPSPYEQQGMSPRLERALCEALEEELTRELALVIEPIMTKIKGCIPAILENCRQKLAGTASSSDDEAVFTPSATSSGSGSNKSGCGSSTKAARQWIDSTTSRCSRLAFEDPPVPQALAGGAQEECLQPPVPYASGINTIDPQDILSTGHAEFGILPTGAHHPNLVRDSSIDDSTDHAFDPTCLGALPNSSSSTTKGKATASTNTQTTTLEPCGLGGYLPPQGSSSLSDFSTSDWPLVGNEWDHVGAVHGESSAKTQDVAPGEWDSFMNEFGI